MFTFEFCALFQNIELTVFIFALLLKRSLAWICVIYGVTFTWLGKRQASIGTLCHCWGHGMSVGIYGYKNQTHAFLCSDNKRINRGAVFVDASVCCEMGSAAKKKALTSWTFFYIALFFCCLLLCLLNECRLVLKPCSPTLVLVCVCRDIFRLQQFYIAWGCGMASV